MREVYDVFISCGTASLHATAQLMHALERECLSCRMMESHCREEACPAEKTRQVIENSGAVIAVIDQFSTDEKTSWRNCGLL